MSITTPILVSTAVANQRRTWRTQIESPKGQPYIVEFFRETVPVDTAGNATGPSVLDLAIGLPALSFVATAASVAALPVQFQGVSALISQFADYLEQQVQMASALVTEQPIALTTDQVAALATNQTSSLTTDQIAALTTYLRLRRLA